MSEKKNYNINTLRGVLNDDDLDVCQTLGIPEDLAYTPAMVEAQLDRDGIVGEEREKTLRMLKKFM